jgi:hypothetical protein
MLTLSVSPLPSNSGRISIRRFRAGVRRRRTLGIALNEIDLEVKSRNCKLLIWCALHDSITGSPSGARREVT